MVGGFRTRAVHHRLSAQQVREIFESLKKVEWQTTRSFPFWEGEAISVAEIKIARTRYRLVTDSSFLNDTYDQIQLANGLKKSPLIAVEQIPDSYSQFQRERYCLFISDITGNHNVIGIWSAQYSTGRYLNLDEIDIFKRVLAKMLSLDSLEANQDIINSKWSDRALYPVGIS